MISDMEARRDMDTMKDEVQLRKEIKNLFNSQRFAVLATLEEMRPYLNLVAFSEMDDLKVILFATTRATRKYSNILSKSGAAMLVDNRSNEVADLRQAIAVTIVGTGAEVHEDERGPCEQHYLEKHPHMKEFLALPTTALISIDVETYYVVTQFQNVAVVRLKR